MAKKNAVVAAAVEAPAAAGALSAEEMLREALRRLAAAAPAAAGAEKARQAMEAARARMEAAKAAYEAARKEYRRAAAAYRAVAVADPEAEAARLIARARGEKPARAGRGGAGRQAGPRRIYECATHGTRGDASRVAYTHLGGVGHATLEAACPEIGSESVVKDSKGKEHTIRRVL